jgi:3-hydroxy-9,10-secoandrosta-1,3,5(10)-triene-9,17-dione monooxygenase reductase component
MTAPPDPVDPDAFRRTIAHWATGVAIVTAHEADRDAGLTVNAMLSVSLRPPLLLISLTSDADTTPVIERTGRFAVSLLSSGQRSVSERFAQALPSDQKFTGIALHRDPDGIPLLDGALAHLRCRVQQAVPVADHRLLIGLVVGADPGVPGLPLLFYRSRYGEADGPESLRVASAPP